MIIRYKSCYLLATTICMAAVSFSTHAWYRGGSGFAYGAHGGSTAWSHGSGVAYGPHGGSAAWSGGSGYAHTAQGGSAAWSGGSGYAHGAYGGSAAWSGGSGYAHGAYGGAAVWSHPTYGYHPPVYYGSSGYSSGDVTAAGIAGLAVGAMAGAAAASRPAPPPTTVVIQQPMAPAPLALGTSLAFLPGGCVNINISSGQYYQCGINWFRPYFGSNGAYYQVVPAPY
ncbi:MAG: hypothetical protein PHD43_02915 [Methylococcales bacterium]|nr:hypothetical protein [Methylococcales bacterium]